MNDYDSLLLRAARLNSRRFDERLVMACVVIGWVALIVFIVKGWA